MKRSMSTINDVAEASGVTIGTVDRVLHERGEVSEKTRENLVSLFKTVRRIVGVIKTVMTIQ